MIDKPVTYAFNYSHTDDVLRRYIFHEMAESGIKNIVLSIDLMAAILKDGPLAATLMAETAAEGLTFVDSHAQFGAFYDLRTPDPVSRTHVVHLQQLQIAIAAEMGVHSITIHPGADFLNPEIPLETQTENVIRTLDQILPVAESLGVVVCIENSWSRLSRPNNLLYIKSKFPTDALGFCYDAGHANVLSSKAKQYETCTARDRWTPYGLEPEWEDQALEKMLPHIVNCHLHDNNAQSDQHKLPGEGTVDWPYVMHGLAKAPRLQCIQCEVGAIKNTVAFPTLCRKFDELVNL